MSETEALLELYGALDRAVVDNVIESESLAPLLGPYRDGAATGWYENQFLPWLEGAKERAVLRERDEREVSKTLTDAAPEVPPDLEAEAAPEHADEPPSADVETDVGLPLRPQVEAIRVALSGFGTLPVESRSAARRLLAVAAAAQALPQHFGPDGSHAGVVRAALEYGATGGDADPDAPGRRAGDLHASLANQFRSMDDWSEMIQSAVSRELLPAEFRSQHTAVPCVGRLIMRPDPITGDLDPCTVLEAEFTTDKLTFDEAKPYLEPANWQFPGSLWCRMERADALPPNSWLYHETVSTDCASANPAWSVSTDLRFWFSHPTAGEARVEYDLAPGLPTPYSDIEIDEGSLRLIKLAHGVRVVTTKRVRFAGAFDGAGLAMFMCAIGYTTVLEDMVFSVAQAPAGYTQPFPVSAPQGGTMGNTNANAKATPSPESGDPESLDDLAAEAGELFASYLKDYAEICTKSMTSIQGGTYKVEDAWSDGIALWTKYVSGMGKALDLGSRTAKAAAQTPVPADSPPTGEKP
jgi:hypothetical protein